jgi:predicted  nucleic acid-binding Zn-ribbon protein
METKEKQEEGNFLQTIEKKTGISKQDVQWGIDTYRQLSEAETRLGEKIVDLQIEQTKAERDISAIKEASRVEIEKIDERHKTVRGYLGEKLAQSRERMYEEFKVIDQALAEHNDLLVVHGLKSLDKLSDENPVDELAEIEKLL